jgi:hypothetical protein
MIIMMAALKEWAIVCKALEEGRQVLLLRKGGIMEYRQGFEIKHNKFLLFPTFEHQSKEYIQPDYINNLDIILQHQPMTLYHHTANSGGRNKLTSYAKVIDVKEVNDKSVIRKLEKYHIWNDRYINLRMDYNPKKPISVLLLRVYKMNNPLEVDIKPEWAGCKSWVSVEFELPHMTVNSTNSRDNNDPLHPQHVQQEQPVIDNSKFNQIAAEIKEVLN